MARRRRRSRSRCHGTDQGGAGRLGSHGRAKLSSGSRCPLSPPVVVASLAPMSAPPSLVPSAALAMKDLEQKLLFMGGQVPPAPTPGSHEAAVAAVELASTLEDGLVDPLVSGCCLMEKEKYTRRYLTNMVCFPIKQAPKHGQNEVCDTNSVLKGKEISGAKSYCAFSTRPTGGDVNKDGQAVPCRNDANNLTQLIKTVCKKKGIRAYDFYAVHGGKPLKDNKLISSYPVYRDSTVFLRHRLRAGCPRVFPFKFCTFDEMIKSHEGGLFRRVNLSHKSISSKTNQNEATFLSYFSQYIAHQVLVYVCGKYLKGLSFNGKFEGIDILFCSGRVRFAKDVERVDFTETTCHEDYKKLKEIFGKCFPIKIENNVPVYPMYVPHLLKYLEKCPGGILSNQEPLIALLTKHPALACYMDRIKQCILLDNMVHALLSAEKQPLQANLGSVYLWSRDILSVPEMKGRYLHKAKINPKTKHFIVNVEYTEQIWLSTLFKELFPTCLS